MLPFLGARFGNASSAHGYGRRAREAIDQARQQVAAAVNAHPTEVIFTSGGTEANNLMLKGLTENLSAGRIAIAATEHPSVREPARQLARRGWQVVELAVDHSGQVDAGSYKKALALAPTLISVMTANNETGVIQDIEALAVQARASGAFFHTDAVQALARIQLDFRASAVHAVSLSAHKIGGPIGAGALVVDKRIDLAPLIAGGGQERALRSGTENLAAIVGFGLACELAVEEMQTQTAQRGLLRDELEAALIGAGAVIFGGKAPRLANTSFFAFDGVAGEALVSRLDRAGYAVASGSACSSVSPLPSATLLAMGVPPELARCAVRVSLGAGNQRDDVRNFVFALAQILNELKGLAAVAA